jgi:hypothetical protein
LGAAAKRGWLQRPSLQSALADGAKLVLITLLRILVTNVLFLFRFIRDYITDDDYIIFLSRRRNGFLPKVQDCFVMLC